MAGKKRYEDEFDLNAGHNKIRFSVDKVRGTLTISYAEYAGAMTNHPLVFTGLESEQLRELTTGNYTERMNRIAQFVSNRVSDNPNAHDKESIAKLSYALKDFYSGEVRYPRIEKLATKFVEKDGIVVDRKALINFEEFERNRDDSLPIFDDIPNYWAERAEHFPNDPQVAKAIRTEAKLFGDKPPLAAALGYKDTHNERAEKPKKEQPKKHVDVEKLHDLIVQKLNKADGSVVFDRRDNIISDKEASKAFKLAMKEMGVSGDYDLDLKKQIKLGDKGTEAAIDKLAWQLAGKVDYYQHGDRDFSKQDREKLAYNLKIIEIDDNTPARRPSDYNNSAIASQNQNKGRKGSPS